MARYGPLAREKVDRAIQEMKDGKLKSDKKIASRERTVVTSLSAEIRKRRAKDLYGED